MRQTLNLPIQLATVFSTIGTMDPKWFRYETEEHEVIMVHILDVLNVKENKYNGIDEIIYTCNAVVGFNEEKLFEVKYNVLSHKWTLFQMLN